MTARRWKLRILGMMAAATAAVFIPPFLWLHSAVWWTRLLGSLIDVVRCAFVGYCAAFVIARPLLTIRAPGERPLISLGAAMRILFSPRHRRDWVAGSPQDSSDEGSPAI